MKGFLGSGVLEAVIGASFVYLLMAAFCSTVNEWISALLNSRSVTLKKAISGLLGDQTDRSGREFGALFYRHPIIKAMTRDRSGATYLSSAAFVTVLLDLSTPGIDGPLSCERLEKSLRELPPGDVRTSLLALIQNAGGSMSRMEANVGAWFNDAMGRASKSYKRRTGSWTAITASLLTLALNADTISLLHGVPLSGWDGAAPVASFPSWIARITGWCLTIAAVSLGTPFWFDVLGRMVDPRDRAGQGRRGSTAG